MTALELMKLSPVIPVIVIDDIKHAVPLANALVKGGIRVLEITMRTPVALEAISLINKEVEGAIVGAGTVTDAKKLESALKAGSQFIISPGLTTQLAEAAKSIPISFIPGAMTPSDVMRAMEYELSELKFFPAQSAGGISMLKSLAGPFPGIRFCPTGGITSTTASEFLALPNVVCVGGTWLTPQQAIAEENWNAITQLAHQANFLSRSQVQ